LDFADKLKEAGYSIIGQPSDGKIELLVSNGEKLIPHLVETMRDVGVELSTVSLKKPTLDDVFLKYTGARIEESETGRETRRERRSLRRLTK
jgi:ABC-2 type transport system ATP-binding protein